MSASNDKVQVLSLGLVRTGTASIAEAYRLLGYKDVLHGLYKTEDWKYWVNMDKLADAMFPNLSTYNGKTPDLDLMFGDYDVVTDIASFYSEALIKRYPNAKVVITTRDLKKWRESVCSTVLIPNGRWIATIVRVVMEPLFGMKGLLASWKMFCGYFKATSLQDCQTKLRKGYEDHHALIQRLVPPERLLVFHVSEGWEPLCKFLDKPIPDVDFPHKNEAAVMKAMVEEKVRDAMLKLILWATPVTVAIIAIGYAYIHYLE